MKETHPILFVIMTLSIMVAACGGVTEAPPSQDQSPIEPASPQRQPTELVAATPSLQPINLAGPPASTPMVWVDGSILVHVPGGEFIVGDGEDDDPIHGKFVFLLDISYEGCQPHVFQLYCYQEMHTTAG